MRGTRGKTRRLDVVAIKSRLRSFLLFQSFPSTIVYFLYKTLISPSASSTTLFAAVSAFLFFQLSLRLFSISLIKAYYLRYVPGASPRATLRFVVLLSWFGVSACISVVCLYGSQPFGILGLRGFLVGLIYGLCQRRCEFDFPVVQRPFYFRYKSGVLKSVIKALKLSTDGNLGSLALTVIIYALKGQLATRDLIIEHMVFFSACVMVFICWEMNRHVLEIYLTTRLLFLPPNESAVVTNPIEYLLEPIENTTSDPHIRDLAYLDLFMLSASKIEISRRAAIFEGSDETYKRVIAVCLKPLQQLTLDLSVPNQLLLLSDPFNKFQVCEWCACSASSLTVRSLVEDRLGVARLSGSNVDVISTLLAALLAVEAFMESPSSKEHYSKAYSMADILRTSVTQIVWNFHDEMVASSRGGLLEKDWITSGKPMYGSRELLVQKLQMFIEFQAS